LFERLSGRGVRSGYARRERPEMTGDPAFAFVPSKAHLCFASAVLPSRTHCRILVQLPRKAAAVVMRSLCCVDGRRRRRKCDDRSSFCHCVGTWCCNEGNVQTMGLSATRATVGQGDVLCDARRASNGSPRGLCPACCPHALVFVR
jgi:hypothetical protein